MRVSTTTIFVMLAAFAGTAALAQSLDQQWAYCENGSGSYSHDQSIAGCSGVIQLGQDSAEDLAIAYYNRGISYRAKQDLTRALADYDQAIRLNPQYAKAYNNRGNAYKAKQDLTRAIADYDQAIRINPQYDKAYYNRGSAYKAQQDLTRALADYDQAIRFNPQYAKAYYNRGVTKKLIGQAADGEADIARARAIDPNIDK